MTAGICASSIAVFVPREHGELLAQIPLFDVHGSPPLHAPAYATDIWGAIAACRSLAKPWSFRNWLA